MEKGCLFSGSWGSTANYFSGAGKQANTFGDLGSTAKMETKSKYKASILFDSLKFVWLPGGR